MLIHSILLFPPLFEAVVVCNPKNILLNFVIWVLLKCYHSEYSLLQLAFVFQFCNSWVSLVAQLVKNPPAMWETWVRSRSPGERKGYPLQYSLLENSMNWIVHGVTKSQTWLSNFHFCKSSVLLCVIMKRSEVKVTQMCSTLCDPMDCSLPGSSAHGIL